MYFLVPALRLLCSLMQPTHCLTLPWCIRYCIVPCCSSPLLILAVWAHLPDIYTFCWDVMLHGQLVVIVTHQDVSAEMTLLLKGPYLACFGFLFPVVCRPCCWVSLMFTVERHTIQLWNLKMSTRGPLLSWFEFDWCIDDEWVTLYVYTVMFPMYHFLSLACWVVFFW